MIDPISQPTLVTHLARLQVKQENRRRLGSPMTKTQNSTCRHPHQKCLCQTEPIRTPHPAPHQLTAHELAKVVLCELRADPEGHVLEAGWELAVALELRLEVAGLELLQKALVIRPEQPAGRSKQHRRCFRGIDNIIPYHRHCDCLARR